MDAGHAGGGAHLRQVGLGAPEGDVLPYGGGEQLGVLENEGNGGVQGGLVHVPQVHPADAYGAGVRVGEACDEGGQCRLARAGGAQQRGHGSRLQGQAGVVDGEGVPVGEGDVVDLDERRARPLGAVGGGQNGGVEDLAQAQGRRPGQLVGPGDRGNGDECGGEDQGDEGCGQDLGQGDGTGMDEQRPSPKVDQEQYGDRDPGEGQTGDGHQGHRPGAVEGGELVGGGEVGRVGAPHAPEGLDHADTGDELDHGRGNGGQLAVHLHGLLVHAAHGHRVGEHVEDECGDGQQGQAPVDPEGAPQQGQRSDDGIEALDGAVGDDGVDQSRVVLNGLAQAPGGGSGEPGQRGVGDSRNDVAAQTVAQGQVGQVGDEQRQEVQQQTGGVGAHEHHDRA